MQTTPLLAALGTAFPSARFDWAVSDWARQAVSTNPRLTRIILTGSGDIKDNSRDDNQALIKRLRSEAYDTCFIPSHSAELEQVARRAGIPQTVSLNTRGIRVIPGESRIALSYLTLAETVGVDQTIIRSVGMEYQPADRDRTAVTRWLVEEYDWLGAIPLIVIHPGGGDNPEQTELMKRWPAERFARLINYLVRTHNARIVLVGLAEEQPLADQVAGMLSFPVINRAGRIGLGELGALCELAALYVGNDTGTTLVAAATGCPTLAIYGPTNPAVHGPQTANERVITLWQPFTGRFTWQKGVAVDEAIAAAEALLAPET